MAKLTSQPGETQRFRFTVELCDPWDPPLRPLTAEQARGIVEDALYQADKHAQFSLNIVDEEK